MGEMRCCLYEGSSGVFHDEETLYSALVYCLHRRKVDEGDLHLLFWRSLGITYIPLLSVEWLRWLALRVQGGITAMNKFHLLYCPENLVLVIVISLEYYCILVQYCHATDSIRGPQRLLTY